MRRDVCYYFETDVVSLYNAYLAAAKNEKFDRTCDEEPYHTFSFGLNFSFKFNMNGGRCTLHFMPYGRGSAVDLRFSIAQGAGARYEKYAAELTEDAVKVLGIAGQKCEIDIDTFLLPTNQITPYHLAPQPVPQPAPVSSRACPQCGKACGADDAFCSGCGNKLPAQGPAFCSQCGAKLPEGAAFCPMCGNKI